MELDNLDKLFVEKATMTTVLETHQPNTFTGSIDYLNQGFKVSKNPIYSMDDIDPVCDNCLTTENTDFINCECLDDSYYVGSLQSRHCKQCLYINCKVHR